MPSISIPAGQEHEGGEGHNGQERRGASHDVSLRDERRHQWRVSEGKIRIQRDPGVPPPSALPPRCEK